MVFIYITELISKLTKILSGICLASLYLDYYINQMQSIAFMSIKSI